MSLRVVRSNFSTKEAKTARLHRTAQEERRHYVYVAEQNSLAAQYLLWVLAKDKALHGILLQDVIEHKSIERTPAAFILDRSGIDLPLAECLRFLRKRYPEAKFVVLDEEHAPAEISQLLPLGIHGFVAYPHIHDQLIKAVHSVVEGKMWISASVLEAYARQSISSLKIANESAPGQHVTQRESQIIELVKRRLSNREIGTMLNITEGTVKFHLSNIFSKLQIKKRNDLQGKAQINEIWKKLMAS
jgi:DNA-binding NarL/FixJ family response regulator